MVRHSLSVGAGVVTIAMLGHGLGREALGAWALIGTSGTLLGLSELGLSTLVLRESVRVGRDVEAARAVALTQWTVLAFGPLAAAIAWFVYVRGIEGGASPTALQQAGCATALGGFASVYFAGHRSWLVGRGAMSDLAWGKAAGAGAQVTTTALGLRHGLGIVAPASGVLAGSLVEGVMCLRAARRRDARLTLIPRDAPRRDEWLAAAREGAAALAINAAAVVAIRLDVAVLARVAPLAAVGAYQLGTRVTDQMYSVTKQVSTALQPQLGTRAGRDRALTLGTAVLSGTLSSALVALTLCGHGLLRAWAGPVVDERVFPVVLGLLSVAAVFASLCEMSSAALTVGARSQWIGARPHIAGALVNGLVTLAGARPFGVWAIAGATVLGNAVTVALTWREALTLQRWSLRDGINVLAPPILALAASLAVGTVMAAWSGTVVGSFVGCALTASAGCAAWWITLRRTPARTESCALHS
jgi:O-antigen/teichoic acid export membrane protein